MLKKEPFLQATPVQSSGLARADATRRAGEGGALSATGSLEREGLGREERK